MNQNKPIFDEISINKINEFFLLLFSDDIRESNRYFELAEKETDSEQKDTYSAKASGHYIKVKHTIETIEEFMKKMERLDYGKTNEASI